ncbi:Urb2 domain-containing protein [Phanerochaete sordida]|uniref:Urb2 domain-containing protein n=1 Tax=Phanerochaete sordida TaxID=48140 RepID=A0A9P3G5B6_9APHY|nr:Urb2 domain-containing protein [Phanerochaete sordida]
MHISPHDFVRALRAPADPPQPGAPQKVQLARDVWNNASLYVPNKAELIAEFLLSRLLKDKDALPDANPILDARYWTLLRDVLAASDVAKSRSAKAWLVPVLQRTPLAPVANAVLASWIHRTAAVPDQVPSAADCLSILWPLAVPKISPETLLDCLGSVVRLLADYPSFRQALDPAAHARVEHLLTQLVGSYRYALANASNKKKLFTAFSTGHLQAWLECIHSQAGSAATIYADVYDAGVETLFTVDVLRQTQDRDSPYLEPLARAVGASPEAACAALPRLFAAFVAATRRHRAALFGQSSHQAPGAAADQARQAALRFLAVCAALCAPVAPPALRWRTLAALLQALGAEGLYGADNGAVDDVLRRVGEDAIGALAQAVSENQQSVIDYTLESLSTIVSIDYDLLSHSTPRILRLLLSVPSSSAPAYAYLKQLLDYHVKTRTLDVLVEAILAACASQTQVDRSAASVSPLLRPNFLDDFAKSLKSFLTPGQVGSTVDTVLRQLREQLQSVTDTGDSSSEPQKKKRKTEKSTPPPANDQPTSAVAFTLTSRVASAVLSSVPTRILHDDARSAVTAAVQDFYAFARAQLRDVLKRIRRGDAARELQWAAAAALRLQYSIRTARAIPVSTQGDQKLSAKLLSTLEAPLLPELRVELLHVLLSDADRGLAAPAPVLDAVLGALERPAAPWSGAAHAIAADAHATTAACHLLVGRWLPLLDAAASDEQLARFARLVTAPQSSSPGYEVPGADLSVADILQRALHNAELWELPRLRDALLAQIDAATRPLDAVDVPAALRGAPSADAAALAPDAAGEIAGAYRLLLHIPAEYLSRGARGELLRRALAADVLCGEGDARARLFVREFLRRLFVFMGSAEHALGGAYLAFLLRSGPQDAAAPAFAATAELVRVHLVACVKAALKGEQALLGDAADHFAAFVAGTPGFASQQLVWHGVMHLVDVVVSEGKCEDYDATVVDKLRDLHKALLASLRPLVQEIASQDLGTGTAADHTLLLNLWHRSLVFQRWFAAGADLHAFGKAIATKLLRRQHAADAARPGLYLAVLSVVAEECRSAQQQDEYLEVVLASYLAFYRECDEHGRRDLDDLVAKFFKGLSGAFFASVLDLVHDGLSRPGLKLEDVANLIHVLTLLSQNAPEGSSKVLQASLTRCLQLFAAKQEFLRNSVVHDEILRFLARQFNDRPALVRPPDLSSVWSILGHTLAGSATHARSTHRAVFHAAVAIVSALVRLRRDLVGATLPHLACVLRRLLAALRQLRPQLGARQRTLVADTLPHWLAPGDALGADEARALARLLTTMAAKTVVRGAGAGAAAAAADGGKAEALARPFAKHAAYVLQAYVAALNDPLCAVPADVRRELEPGLFALCDMMGEYSRDALMAAALDAGGKAVLKAVWREYEKQKYVGRG